MSWVLVLVVWSATGVADGRMQQFATEAECHTAARQDTPRVRSLYPNQRFRWSCIDGSSAEIAKPKGAI